MFKQGNKLYSIFNFKCPKCHKGDIYINQNPYSFKQFFDMPENCSNCGFRFLKEPGFFYGAMYVSYALSIMLAGLTWFVMTLLDFEFHIIIFTIIPILILAIPVLFKISRAIWLNFFTDYEPEDKA